MKKNLFLAMVLPMAIHAQYNGRVGINTDTPKATLDINRKELNTLPAGQSQGVIFPKFSTAERSTFSNPEVGTMIYNTDKNCIEIYRGVLSGAHQWSCLPDTGSSAAQSVAVTPQGFEGSYVGGIPFTNANKTKFRVENNSFSPVNSSFADAVSIQNGSANISITDCKWKLLPSGSENSCSGSSTVNLASGQSALLTYTMSGTPETGTLQANFNKLGATADQSTAVGLGSASLSNKTEYVVSLTYSGTNIQGKINNASNKLVVKIPYKSGSGSYNAVTSDPITTALGQGNDTNTLTLNIPQGNFGVNGYLDATITVGGSDQEYLVKMLAPGQDYTIATIPYTLNGQSYNLVLKGIGGVPDKKFGVRTNGKLEHQFIYIPIMGSDGKLWLNNNLGADYSNINSSAFNPLQQATSLSDKNAYGSHFQWGRDADGHELVTYPTSTSGNRVNPNIPLYSNSQLQTYTNPCPDGYHVPTKDEWQAYLDLLSSKNASGWFADPLKLTYAGDLSEQGSWSPAPGAVSGWFWSSSPSSSGNAWGLDFYGSSSSTYSGYSYRSWGRPLRCRQD